LAKAERGKTQQLGRILVDLGQELSSVATPQEAARIILHAADDLLGWDACAVDLLDGDEGYSLISVDTINGERKEFTRVYGKIRPDSMFRRVLDNGATLILRSPEDPDKEGRLRSFGDESHPSAALLFVPVRKGSVYIGVMTVQSYTHDFYDEGDLHLLQVLADYCSGCLSRTFAEVRLREAEKKRVELLNDLQERERIMNHDLALAQELQQRFLPEHFPFPGELSCAAVYRACTLVGGDLYDVFELHFLLLDSHTVQEGPVRAFQVDDLKCTAPRNEAAVLPGKKSVTDRHVYPARAPQDHRVTREVHPTHGFVKDDESCHGKRSSPKEGHTSVLTTQPNEPVMMATIARAGEG